MFSHPNITPTPGALGVRMGLGIIVSEGPSAAGHKGTMEGSSLTIEIILLITSPILLIVTIILQLLFILYLSSLQSKGVIARYKDG